MIFFFIVVVFIYTYASNSLYMSFVNIIQKIVSRENYSFFIVLINILH